MIPPDDAAKMRIVAEKIGLRIHSVTRGWAEFNNPDASVAQKTFEVTEGALRTAEAFGADAILLVPCWIGERNGRGTPVAMPRPWEYQIEFDEKTGHLTRVVYGDNARFAEYIKVHNHATDTSREWVRRLIPLAEKTKVIVALENVTNHLWVKPDLFSHFVRSFQSPWVKAYYDIGNHVRFAPPEQWILALGDQTVRIHVKDYRLDPADPNGMGQGVNIREGNVRWPVLRQALESVNFSGWMTIEGSGDLSMAERSQRLDQIIAGASVSRPIILLHSAGAASRMAALLRPQIRPVFSVVAPCPAGASPPSVLTGFMGRTLGRYSQILSSPFSMIGFPSIVTVVPVSET